MAVWCGNSPNSARRVLDNVRGQGRGDKGMQEVHLWGVLLVHNVGPLVEKVAAVGEEFHTHA